MDAFTIFPSATAQCMEQNSSCKAPETPARNENERQNKRGDLKVDIDAAKRAVSNALAGIEVLTRTTVERPNPAQSGALGAPGLTETTNTRKVVSRSSSQSSRISGEPFSLMSPNGPSYQSLPNSTPVSPGSREANKQHFPSGYMRSSRHGASNFANGRGAVGQVPQRRLTDTNIPTPHHRPGPSQQQLLQQQHANAVAFLGHKLGAQQAYLARNQQNGRQDHPLLVSTAAAGGHTLQRLGIIPLQVQVPDYMNLSCIPGPQGNALRGMHAMAGGNRSAIPAFALAAAQQQQQQQQAQILRAGAPTFAFATQQGLSAEQLAWQQQVHLLQSQPPMLANLSLQPQQAHAAVRQPASLSGEAGLSHAFLAAAAGQHATPAQMAALLQHPALVPNSHQLSQLALQQMQQQQQQAALGLQYTAAREAPPAAPEPQDPQAAQSGEGLLATYEELSLALLQQARHLQNLDAEQQLQGEVVLLTAVVDSLLRLVQSNVPDLDVVADMNFLAVSARRHLHERPNISAAMRVALQALTHVIFLLCPAEKAELHGAAMRLMEALTRNDPQLAALTSHMLAQNTMPTPALTHLATQVVLALAQSASRVQQALYNGQGNIPAGPASAGATLTTAGTAGEAAPSMTTLLAPKEGDPKGLEGLPNDERWLARSLSAPPTQARASTCRQSNLSTIWARSANSAVTTPWGASGSEEHEGAQAERTAQAASAHVLDCALSGEDSSEGKHCDQQDTSGESGDNFPRLDLSSWLQGAEPDRSVLSPPRHLPTSPRETPSLSGVAPSPPGTGTPPLAAPPLAPTSPLSTSPSLGIATGGGLGGGLAAAEGRSLLQAAMQGTATAHIKPLKLDGTLFSAAKPSSANKELVLASGSQAPQLNFTPLW
eukprot:CAMPEP_0202907638 /NCGR_PEP_ID=MMETSP1392-20130828/43347_1 /ASSEMBLY_ACC=CAM_ASM_000868 /TAXON_ID=225041 /ORGANISM="Chlamydomonas chlamydogama, Strain SAG 11-48b" /LENGTH=884 /DNA_ID=CAMNT_0049596637 /DNA_START=166 /DNA_END=2820 /DNA_ORIENTATION=+